MTVIANRYFTDILDRKYKRSHLETWREPDLKRKIIRMKETDYERKTKAYT